MADLETLSLERQEANGGTVHNATHPQNFLEKVRITQQTETAHKTELTEEFRATHGDITIAKMRSGELDKSQESAAADVA